MSCLLEAGIGHSVSFVFTPLYIAAVTVGLNNPVEVFVCLLHEVLLPARYYTVANFRLMQAEKMWLTKTQKSAGPDMNL